MVAWSDPAYEAIVRHIHERAGLVFPSVRQAAIEGTIQRAMARAGVSDTAHFAMLVRREHALREELLTELTVGETYFLREPAQFDFLRREIIPGLLRRRAETAGPLRFWSAGCASGEEPYSLAILCEQLGLLGRTRIVGTELSRQRLEVARRARYGRWSFRGVPHQIIQGYFERRGNHFELDPRLRAAVEFRSLNLAEESYPSPETGLAELDLILCRNVLIYFDLKTVAAVARRLLASLGKGGWLLLGASDPLLSELVPCTVVMTGNGIAYRRVEAGAEPGPYRYRTVAPPPFAAPAPFPAPAPAPFPASAPPPVSAPFARPVGEAAAGAPATVALPFLPDVPGDLLPAGLPATPAAELSAAYARGDYQLVTDLAEAAIEGGGEDEVHCWILWVRALANQGRLAQAGRVCARALDRHRLSAELAYLHAVLLLHAGRDAAAAAAARRALYLDRGLIMGHLIYARARGRLGEREGELHSLRNARRLLVELGADAVVPSSDGARAGYLRELVRAQLRYLMEVH